MISLRTKIELAVGLLLILVTGFSYFKYQSSESKYSELLGTTEELEVLKGNILKLKTEYLSTEELLKDTKKKFKELEIARTEKVKLVTELETRIKQAETTDSVIGINGVDSPEICYKKDDKLGLFPFTIRQDLALLKDSETGKERMLSQTYFILDPEVMSVWAGKPYKLTETVGVLKTDPREEKEKDKLLFLPLNLNLGLNSNINTSFTVTLLGLGPDKERLNLKFLSVGAGFTKDSIVGLVTLFSTKVWPTVLNNSYIGLDYQSDKRFGISFNVEL